MRKGKEKTGKRKLELALNSHLCTTTSEGCSVGSTKIVMHGAHVVRAAIGMGADSVRLYAPPPFVVYPVMSRYHCTSSNLVVENRDVAQSTVVRVLPEQRRPATRIFFLCCCCCCCYSFISFLAIKRRLFVGQLHV